LADPQHTQLNALLGRLTQARLGLSDSPPDLAQCDSVTDIDSRLQGEPGLTDVKPAWPALRDATDALLAACGQALLLAQPYETSAATTLARQRWQAGVSRQLSIACQDMQRAAQALSQPQPC
jgi:hypothetical protein